MKIVPMNRKVLVEMVSNTEKKDKSMEEFGIVIPNLPSINKKKAFSEGKYIFKVLASNNPSIKVGMKLLSDTSNIEEYNFLLDGQQYNLTFIDELDIISLFVEEDV